MSEKYKDWPPLLREICSEEYDETHFNYEVYTKNGRFIPFNPKYITNEWVSIRSSENGSRDIKVSTITYITKLRKEEYRT